jgi:3-hydroxyisobutyrate dehydrogenase
MGQSMAGHILKADYPLNVYNRTRAKADDLLTRGAVWCASPGELAAVSDVVVTIVGYPQDVEQVYLGSNGIVANAHDALLIDMTTSSPELAQRIAQAAGRQGCRALDAPVSGGDVGARDARLSIMVGGEQAAFEAALPILRLMGANIVLQGGPGAGQHTKMCNQIVIASTIMGVCEGLAYGKAAGLDLPTVLKSIGGGAASGFQLTVLGPKIIDGDFAPGFFVEHFIKDLGIALAEAESIKLSLPALALARRLYTELAQEGHGRLGTHALFKHYEAWS